MFGRSLLMCSAAWVLGIAASAPAGLITFEDVPVSFSGGTRTGVYTSLSGVVDGITVTISRLNGQGFDIVDNTVSGQAKPAPFENRSFDPFVSFPSTGTGNGDSEALVITFSAPVKVVSLRFGDYVPPAGMTPDADAFTLIGFQNNTQIVATSTEFLFPGAPGTFDSDRVTVIDAAMRINKVHFFAGGSSMIDDLSVFIDRIYFSAVSTIEPSDVETRPGDPFFVDPNVGGQIIPEPASATLLGLAAMTLLMRPRRKRS